tara:strand:+ start:288 stop:968 length:681 start_codon:yes stop_codon:yes gene_type:complete
MRVHITKKSANKKVGPITVTTSERSSCPSDCPFKDESCYAESGFHLRMHWDKVSSGERGTDWNGLCDFIANKVKTGDIWRHNQAGDMPHVLGMLNEPMIKQLVEANKGKRGYTYTHHKLSPLNVKVLKNANDNGFTINASCETLEQVDNAIDKGLPAAVVIPSDKEPPKTTPKGRRVMVCPAQTQEDMNCAKCKLCSVSNRRCAVAFFAHGTRENKANQVLNNLST